jgi:hypothetical protein
MNPVLRGRVRHVTRVLGHEEHESLPHEDERLLVRFDEQRGSAHELSFATRMPTPNVQLASSELTKSQHPVAKSTQRTIIVRHTRCPPPSTP